jgi:uncharacterized protein with von Willebrand factor type A (vWA) domain
MKKDEARTLLDVLNELVESGTDLTEAIRGTVEGQERQGGCGALKKGHDS